jgi:uncharacterized protein (DUF1919 family)
MSRLLSYRPPRIAIVLMSISIGLSYFSPPLNSFWSPDDYYCFVNTFKYEKEKVILDKYTIIEESRKRVVYNWLQYFSKDSLRNEFEENGFRVKEVYSDVAGKTFTRQSPEIAIIAKKV